MLDAGQTEIVSREDLVPAESPVRTLPSVDWSSILGYNIEDQDDIDIASSSSLEGETKPAEISFRLFASTDNAQSFILPPSPPPEQAAALLAVGDLTPGPPVSHFSEQDVENAHATYRPLRYYLTPPLEADDERAKQIKDAAVSGEDILKGSTQRWWGCELPWRVTKLTIHGIDRNLPSPSPSSSNTTTIFQGTLQKTDEGKKRNRPRPNKKRRIILRQRRAVQEAQEAVVASKNAIKKKNKKKNKKIKAEVGQAVQAVVHKRTEDEDREKKTRLNRLKKLRKKLKEKEKAEQPAGEWQPSLPSE
ncbi:hypothetical protein ABW20_dc0105056 [Dactylellina cionopaga]|nr:hypothetical protein ABW20_dc0105056 [Dactylellina cionopaga]